MIPKKIIDNSGVKLSAFLNSVSQEIPNTQFDIATAFFNIQAYACMVADSVGLGKTWIAKKVIEEFGFYVEEGSNLYY